MCPCPLESKEIDGLLVPPGKASTLLTDYLITGYCSEGLSLPRKSSSNHPYI